MSRPSLTTITRDELKLALEGANAPELLEALPEKYYRHGHLPGARLFPHDRARELAFELLPDMNRLIVVYCASETCENSHTAARILSELGYRDVRVYIEGKADWQAAGLPLER